MLVVDVTSPYHPRLLKEPFYREAQRRRVLVLVIGVEETAPIPTLTFAAARGPCPSCSHMSSPSTATCLKTEILTEKRDHVILNAIGDLARVSALVHLEAVRDSVLIKNVMQFGGIDA